MRPRRSTDADLRAFARVSSLVVAWAFATACSTVPENNDAACGASANRSDAIAAIDAEVYRRAETERADRLAHQLEQLRADLARAEEAVVSAESDLRGSHSRADAVSSLAEARIHVERAAERAPWRHTELEAVRSKLDDANTQIEEGHFGAALFFVYRARRMSETIEAEAQFVYSHPGVRFVGAQRVNMRSGPSRGDSVLRILEEGTPVITEGGADKWVLVRASSGDVGWIHRGLLRRR